MSSEPLADADEAQAPLAISVRGLSKCYQIYEQPEDRLKQALLPRLHRLAGRAGRRYYREFWALRDVSFDVRRGETLGVIGKNGSGKSTLLQIICGTLTPTSGEVQVTGRVAALLELGSGFNPEFTGRENIHMSGAVLGLTREQVDARFDDIVAFADIGAFIGQPVKTYSSGMYVRLAFAVIAHADADILVIDEALSVGDVFFAQKCMRFLRKFQQTGTVIFVSHDASAVVNLCDRALLLEQGRMTREGDAKTVSEAYLAAAYALPRRDVAKAAAPEPADADRDARAGIVDRSTLRNDIQVFRFDPDRAGFGNGSARILAAHMSDALGNPVTRIVGGETVRLTAACMAAAALHSPIVGFYLKDRLGQQLFGDNTYLSYADSPLQVQPGETFEAVFEFRMPILPRGPYSIDLAVADGTHHEHVQGDWIHDAIVLESHSSSLATGLVGIPMKSISLHLEHDPRE
jgi:lipopolysaccharide transport system ATP-binding protein